MEGIYKSHLDLVVLEVSQSRQEIQNHDISGYKSTWENGVLIAFGCMLEHLRCLVLQWHVTLLLVLIGLEDSGYSSGHLEAWYGSRCLANAKEIIGQA